MKHSGYTNIISSVLIALVFAACASAQTPATQPAATVKPLTPSSERAERAAQIHKVVDELIAEAKALDQFKDLKVTLKFSRPHPSLASWGPDMSLDVLQRMLQPFTSGPGSDFRDTYIRWHLMWVVKKATQADRLETGPRLITLIDKMPNALTAVGRQVYRHEPEDKYNKWYALAVSGRTVVGFPPFQRYVDPPESYQYFDAAKAAQVKANLIEAEKLKDSFKTVYDKDAETWNNRLYNLNYVLRQYRGELIYSLILTGDPDMVRKVMNVIDVRARAKDPIAFDLLAYFYLAAFDGALNLYDQKVLDELSDKLKSTAEANQVYVKYGGVDRNFGDYAFHMIYMLKDGGGFISPKDMEDPNRKLKAD